MSEAPAISICQLAFPNTTFSEDVALCRELGVGGISIDEKKLVGEGVVSPQEFLDSGLRAVICTPAVLTTLPSPRFPSPSDLPARVEAVEAFIRKVAAYRPEAILICAGPAGNLSDEEAAETLAGMLRPLAEAAAEVGTRLSLEPMRLERRATWSFINSMDEAARFCDSYGLDMGLTIDTWHVWDSPDLERQIRQHLPRVSGIQVADYRPSEVAWDRLLPGEGLGDIPSIFSMFARAGFTGWLDIEIFSETLWALPPRQFLQAAVEATRRCWEEGLSMSEDE